MSKKTFSCIQDAIINHPPLRKATENLLEAMYPTKPVEISKFVTPKAKVFILTDEVWDKMRKEIMEDVKNVVPTKQITYEWKK
jgi:hypothetical protein